MVELAAKTSDEGWPVVPKTMVELVAFAEPIETAPLPVVSTCISGLADDEVAIVHANGVPLGIVVVELTE